VRIDAVVDNLQFARGIVDGVMLATRASTAGQSASSSASGWFVLAGAGVAGFFGMTGALVTHRLSARERERTVAYQEHARQQDERRSLYSRLLGEITTAATLLRARTRDDDKLTDALHRLQLLLTEIEIATPKLFGSAAQLVKYLQDAANRHAPDLGELGTLRSQVVEAMKSDLGSTP
jgi:hypothetical protein